MFRTLTIATTILTFLHSYVSAQAPTCLPGFDTWSFNSLNQSPCTMTVALGGACVNGAFTLDPLQPGFVYLGPTQITQNSCRCSTVYYSLLSACALCQNETYLDWSIYDVNCSTVYTRIFLDPIPSNILVPHYAYLDVVTDNTFNIIAAMNAGGPESSPVPQATSTASTASTTSTTPASPNPNSTPDNSTPNSVSATSHKLNVGAIAGGVVGGVAFVGILAGLIAFSVLRYRRRSVLTSPSTNNANALLQPMMSDGEMRYNATVPAMSNVSMTSSPGKLYDPNDPSTFPSDPGPVTGYSAYSSSPQQSSPQRITPTITGNSHTAVPVSARTQYTGAPEL